ncbi:Polar-differentiation response regulator DivK [Myxococcaceae bacterium]|jgi:CheY-like chemotaxis protein|nr:Polar-differentiation response regulator DivK [Myxococcaceae bacterium]
MKRSILLIEDDERNRYLATFLLERSGYAVESAIDGPSGLDRARSLRPDLILLDIQLPGMDGYEVATRLKTDPVLRSIPIVAVTSYAMVGDRERAMAAGCDGYLEKPIDPERFVGEVSRFLPEGG